MPALKFGFAVLSIIAGLSTAAHAQKPPASLASGDYPASQLRGGLPAYYGMTPNFANYGLSGTYPSSGGYGYPGYGPGPQFGAHYPATPDSKASEPSKKSANPMKSSSKPVGRPVGPGVGSARTIPLSRKKL